VYMATSRNTEGSIVREKENAVMLWARFWAEETSEGSSATQFRSRCAARPLPTQHPGDYLLLTYAQPLSLAQSAIAAPARYLM
jgi:hypothetical protein